MVLKYPGAKWEPLGTQTEPAMKSHDILCFHTMVGSLAGTSNMFHENGYGGTESHFGVGESKAQGIEQWQDVMRQADANLDGGHRVVSIETADYGGVFGTWSTKSADNVPPWTADQLDMLVDLTVWFCRKETHANCPSTWKCHQVGVPCALIPDTKPGRRGMGYHKQGCDPYRVDGGEKWSSAYAKGCPGPARIKQLTTIVIPRAQKILAGSQEDELMGAKEEILDYLEAVSIQVQKNNAQLIRAAVVALQSEIDAVDDEVWNRQIADVSTPESGDTAAAATLLTHAANRGAERAIELLQPQLDSLKAAVEALSAALPHNAGDQS